MLLFCCKTLQKNKYFISNLIENIKNNFIKHYNFVTINMVR